MEVQSNENAALFKLLKSKSRTKTELLKVSSAVPERLKATLASLHFDKALIARHRICRQYPAPATRRRALVP